MSIFFFIFFFEMVVFYRAGFFLRFIQCIKNPSFELSKSTFQRFFQFITLSGDPYDLGWSKVTRSGKNGFKKIRRKKSDQSCFIYIYYKVQLVYIYRVSRKKNLQYHHWWVKGHFFQNAWYLYIFIYLQGVSKLTFSTIISTRKYKLEASVSLHKYA